MGATYDPNESPERLVVERGDAEPDGGIVALGKELASGLNRDDAPGLAAEAAYHAVFSIPAILVLLIALGGVLDNLFNFELAPRLHELIDENAPRATQDVLTSLVDNAVERVDGGIASIGLAGSALFAIWAGSNGVGALIKAFNRAYDTAEVRSFPRKKLVSILLTIVLGVVVNFAFVLWVFGGQIGRWAAREYQMGSTFDWAWNLSRFPVGVAVLVSMLSLLYYYGPAVNQRFRWVLPGAVLSTAVWGLLVFGFSIYLRFATPGGAYGALGGMLIFLFFLYLTSFIFLAGGELNAALARRHDGRYRRAVQQHRSRRDATIPAVRREPDNEPRPAPQGSLLVGVAAVVGILAASFLRHRNS